MERYEIVLSIPSLPYSSRFVPGSTCQQLDIPGSGAYRGDHAARFSLIDPLLLTAVQAVG
jgi:hypothetical protein